MWQLVSDESCIVFTSIETVLSCSLLMAFSAAFVVFTISACFSPSSFCERKKRTEFRTENHDAVLLKVRTKGEGKSKHSVRFLRSVQVTLIFVVFRVVCEFLRQVQATPEMRPGKKKRILFHQD